jgi:hypothetical protein
MIFLIESRQSVIKCTSNATFFLRKAFKVLLQLYLYSISFTCPTFNEGSEFGFQFQIRIRKDRMTSYVGSRSDPE